ncbi:hypothetical protein AGLY_006923 [Aphis glycines]|uniref:Uncharacterized protein n=1 Tax=Aphis glycines TaxID=307491 RepID=A0A6G0TQ77_APHGL|nr:hypothetical protein AGLY_006923 [Aphis glycines]
MWRAVLCIIHVLKHTYRNRDSLQLSQFLLTLSSPSPFQKTTTILSYWTSYDLINTRNIIIHHDHKPPVTCYKNIAHPRIVIRIINVYLDICINDSNIYLSKYNTIGKKNVITQKCCLLKCSYIITTLSKKKSYQPTIILKANRQFPLRIDFLSSEYIKDKRKKKQPYFVITNFSMMITTGLSSFRKWNTTSIRKENLKLPLNPNEN